MASKLNIIVIVLINLIKIIHAEIQHATQRVGWLLLKNAFTSIKYLVAIPNSIIKGKWNHQDFVP